MINLITDEQWEIMKKCKVNNKITTLSFEMEKMAINSLHYFNGFRDGLQKLLKIYNWTDKDHTYCDIVILLNYCRKKLFGSDFPKD